MLIQAPEGAVIAQKVNTPGCLGGVVYDDGSFESRYQFADASPVDMVMRLDLESAPVPVDQACLCFTRTGGDDTVDFDLLFYAADGAGSQPGSFLTGIGGLRATGVPLWPNTAFFDLDLRAFPLTVDQTRLYFGVSWDTTEDTDVFLCGDDNGPSTQPLAVSTNLGNSWADLRGFFPEVSALGLRARFGGQGPGGPGGGFTCVPDEETLCLNQGRFQVRVDWENRQGATGTGKTVEFGSDDSGMFTFFSANNWELLVKVLDGCNAGGNYWVFFAAVTNVEFTLTVTDSQTGLQRTYFNPQGSSADAVTDTAAFATCP